MAVVRPFPGVTFALENGPDVSLHTAPPYDVVSPRQRAALLASDAHNVVALELPEGGDDRYRNASRIWTTWLSDGVLVEDRPAFYVLEQRFQVEGRRVARRALIAAVDLEPFSAGVILPHERTLPKALSDRLRAAARHASEPLAGVRPVLRPRGRHRRPARSRAPGPADDARDGRRGYREHRVGDPRPAPPARAGGRVRGRAHLHRRRPPPLHHGARLPRRAPGRVGRGRREHTRTTPS